MKDTQSLKTAFWKTAGAASFFMMLWYLSGFRWDWALCIMGALYVHEHGHAFAAKSLGIKPGLMTFHPFGMVVSLPGVKAKDMAFVSIAGPLAGMLPAFLAAAIYLFTGKREFAALASFIGLINLFNLFPLHPLDGGRVVHSIVMAFSSRASVWFSGLCIAAALWLSLQGGIVFALLAMLAFPEFMRQIGEHRMDKIRSEALAKLSRLYDVPAEPRAVILARLANWRLARNKPSWSERVSGSAVAEKQRRAALAENVWVEYATLLSPKQPLLEGRTMLVRVLRLKQDDPMNRGAALTWTINYAVAGFGIYLFTYFVGRLAAPTITGMFQLLR